MIGRGCRRTVGALGLASALTAACSGGGGPKQAKQSGPLSQGVVARVDGTEITVAEVERLAKRGSMTPSAALARLEAEALLAAEAERRGYADDAPVGAVAEQAEVQALLADGIDSVEPTEAEIDAAFTANQARFHTPELRAASHVLASVPKDAPAERDHAARAVAVDAARRLRAAADPVAAVEEYARASETPRVGVDVKVEELPPVRRAGEFVSEFSDALFALSKAGAVSDPVRTQFGWHVIVLREIVPERHVPDATAREELRAELAKQKRQQKFDGLVRSLQSRTRVTYGSDIKSALATLEF